MQRLISEKLLQDQKRRVLNCSTILLFPDGSQHVPEIEQPLRLVILTTDPPPSRVRAFLILSAFKLTNVDLQPGKRRRKDALEAGAEPLYGGGVFFQIRQFFKEALRRGGC